MTIAFNNSADLVGSDSISSLTVPYPLGSGSNLLIVVVDGADSVDDVTGVTYAGTPMTLTWRIAGQTGHFDSVSMWHLLSPASGTNNVIVTASTTHRIRAIAADYTGVELIDQPDAISAGFSSNTGINTYTDSVTTVDNNSWAILGTAIYQGGTVATAGAGSTLRVFGAFYGFPAIFDSNGPITPAGSYSMTVTVTGAQGAMQIASFSPPPAGSTSQTFYFNNVF